MTYRLDGRRRVSGYDSGDYTTIGSSTDWSEMCHTNDDLGKTGSSLLLSKIVLVFYNTYTLSEKTSLRESVVVPGSRLSTNVGRRILRCILFP